MKVIEIPVEMLREAPWNPNHMDEATNNRLKESIRRYGMVEPLVVRPMPDSGYEVLSGNHRLRVIKEMVINSMPCVIVDLDDEPAMLLAEALNGIHGEDDLVLKGGLFKKVLEKIPAGKILTLLPETVESLRSLSTFKQTDLAEHLRNWEQTRTAHLRHMQLQFTDKQLELVEEAIARMLPRVWNTSTDNPNRRSEAIFLICKEYMEKAGQG